MRQGIIVDELGIERYYDQGRQVYAATKTSGHIHIYDLDKYCALLGGCTKPWYKKMPCFLAFQWLKSRLK